jgi:zinc and cadmium transporter
LSLHSLIEGVALAASIEAGGEHGALAAGFGTFLVIALHKPFDSMTLGALMHLGDRSTRLRHVINLLFALLVPVGALLFHLGMGGSHGHAEGTVVAAALAFSAGTFLCIATSDLLPELQFHSHDRGKLSAALLVGLAIAWGISRLEASMHGHDHSTTETTEMHDHDHAGHDHDH